MTPTSSRAEQLLTSLAPSTPVSGVYARERRRWWWGRGQDVRGRLDQLRGRRRCRLCDVGVRPLRVKGAVFADVSVGGGGVGLRCAGVPIDTWPVIRAGPPPWGRAAQPVKPHLLNSDRFDRVVHNLPDCPSTLVNVCVVVTVRCLRRGSSRLVNRAASVAVLLSWTRPLLTGVLTAEKERVFLGVAAWLRDRDRPPELDCCFLLRSVLRAEAGRKRGDAKTAGTVTPPSRKRVVSRQSYLASFLVVLWLWE